MYRKIPARFPYFKMIRRPRCGRLLVAGVPTRQWIALLNDTRTGKNFLMAQLKANPTLRCPASLRDENTATLH